jgi:hypothetical protein
MGKSPHRLQTKAALRPQQTFFHPLYDYWLAKHHEQKLPARKDIDPLDIPALLPFLALIDVIPRQTAPPRLRYRLIGTQVAWHSGGDRTGDWLDQSLCATDDPAALAPYHEVIRSRRVCFSQGQVRKEERDHTDFTCMLLPLSEDGLQVSMLLVQYHFADPRILPPV